MATTSPAMSVDNYASTKDRDWVRASFMLAVNRWKPHQGTMNEQDKQWLYFSTANYKSSNTSLGGNFTINSIAQFTHTCDLPRGGLDKTAYLQDSTLDTSMTGGMGRYYSESIDDWSMKVAFRFGVPEYKGLITFFTSFYDVGAAMLGRQGRLSNGLFYNGAKIIASLIALPLTVMVWVGEAMQWMANRPSSRYYNLKPAMALYWQRVNLIANMLAANMNLTPRNTILNDAADTLTKEMDPRYGADGANIKGSYGFDAFKKAYPKMFMEHGGIDMYYIATKFSRMHYAKTQNIKKMLESKGVGWMGQMRGDVDKHIRQFTFNDTMQPGVAIDAYLKRYHESRLGWADVNGNDVTGSDSAARYISEGIRNTSPDGTGTGNGATSVGTVGDTGPGGELSEGSAVPGAEGGGTEGGAQPSIGDTLVADSADDGQILPILVEKAADGSIFEKVGGWATEYAAYANLNVVEGGQWINFRVDTVKSVDESFTNNVGPSEIQGKINGMSSAAAGVRFGLSDFQTGNGPLDGIVQTIRDTFMGVADGLHIGGLAALMGGGFVDIPQRWMDSASQMPTSSYTIKCRPPYGNVMSRFLNMHVPVACLLAAALPISYGRHAYGSPMLCEFYVQGKNQSRLAMITSLGITRGEGNLGWSQDGEFLGCDINFEVTDLSTIMHAPIDSGMQIIGNFRWLMSDDNVFNDYMAVLSNLSIAEMTYSWEKLKLNWKRYAVTQQNFVSPARIAMIAGDSGPGRMVRKFGAAEGIATR